MTIDQIIEVVDAVEAYYPLDVFPEPDLAKAQALLEAGGMSLDAVSASNFRHICSVIRTDLLVKMYDLGEAQ